MVAKGNRISFSFSIRRDVKYNGLVNSVKTKTMLYKNKCFLNNPDSSNENAYKSYKNELAHSLRVAKLKCKC